MVIGACIELILAIRARIERCLCVCRRTTILRQFDGSELFAARSSQDHSENRRRMGSDYYPLIIINNSIERQFEGK